MDLDALAAIAADPDAAPAARVDALVTVVERIAVIGTQVPDAIADALDDLVLVDAAIVRHRASAITAALHQLGPRDDLRTTRRRVVRRLLVAGIDGLPLAGLAISIGDLVPGATLAARDFTEHVLPRVRRIAPDPLVRAWLGWLAKQDPAARAQIVVQLRALPTGLRDALVHASDADAAAIASVAG